MICVQCGKETNNPKFCSSSCSASYNNKISPKRLLVNECVDCGTKVRSNVKRCKKCFEQAKTNTLQALTLGEIKQLYKDKTTMAVAAKIRGYGKTIYDRSNKPKQCIVCGYRKHYEVCHIKSVSSYSDSVTMAEIHSLINLVALCPNCHWEFDRGLLSLDY